MILLYDASKVVGLHQITENNVTQCIDLNVFLLSLLFWAYDWNYNIYTFLLPVVVWLQHSLDKDANVNVNIHLQFYDFLML